MTAAAWARKYMWAVSALKALWVQSQLVIAVLSDNKWKEFEYMEELIWEDNM